MRAIMLSNETLSKITNAFMDFLNYEHPDFPYNLPEDLTYFEEAGYTAEDLPKRLYSELRQMNLTAVYREPDTDEEDTYIYDANFDDEEWGQYQAIKSIDCFLYQCRQRKQGDLQKLYSTVCTMRDKLCHQIVCSDYNYISAKWGD